MPVNTNSYTNQKGSRSVDADQLPFLPGAAW